MRVAILADMARNPAYAADEVDRERKLQVDRIEQAEKDGTALGVRLRMAVAFGLDHPYGRPTLGFKRTVAALTVADVAAFHASAWKPDATALLFVGDITPAEAKAVAQKELGSWSGSAPPPPTIRRRRRSATARSSSSTDPTPRRPTPCRSTAPPRRRGPTTTPGWSSPSSSATSPTG